MTVGPTLAASHPHSGRDVAAAVSSELGATQAIMAFTQALVTVLALLAGTLPHTLGENSASKKVSIALDLSCDGKVGTEGRRGHVRSAVGGLLVCFSALGRSQSPFLASRQHP